MKRKEYNFITTHIFADGTVMTHEEFTATPFVVEYAKNKKLIDEAQRVFDPHYAIREKERRRIERAEKRKAELAAEAERIQIELESL